MNGRGSGRPPSGVASISDALLRSGATHFSRLGFSGASIRAILSEAGATAPALYHHFDNKVGLYVAAASAAQDHVLEVFENAVEGRDTVGERANALIEAAARLRMEHPKVAEYLGVIQQDVSRHPDLSALCAYQARFDEFWRGVAGNDSASSAFAVRAIVEGLLSVGGAGLGEEDLIVAARHLRVVVQNGFPASRQNGQPERDVAQPGHDRSAGGEERVKRRTDE